MTNMDLPNKEETTKKEMFHSYDKKIDDLYTFRDKYYILNEASTSPEDRNQELMKKMNELIEELESLDESKFDSKSSYLTLVGKTYNVWPEYSQKACDSLTKAIKLDPKCVDAWNYLGECYWKNRDFEMCKNCFEQSSNITKNKLSLRGMSMVMRQLINVPVNKEQLQNQQAASSQTQQQQQMAKYDTIKNYLEVSIKYAKESLQLDVKDGMSWYVLANCYVAKFFSPFGQQNSALLKQAISAYNLALKDESVASLQSDLYFNKSMISMYEENWADVLFCLSKGLVLDPHWAEVKENLKGTLDYLTQLSEMIEQKGKLKPKKFQSLIEGIKSSQLGPYLDGYKVTKDDKETKIELKNCALKELEKGLNKNKVLIGKVICGGPTKSTDSLNIVCFTCCIADSNGDCSVLTVYNLAGGHGVIIGDSVAIPEPWLEKVEFGYDLNANFKNRALVNELKGGEASSSEFKFKFDSIRVENPTVLVVNGKKWTKEKVSSAFFVPKVISD